ncbi:hypothetical protein [Sphingomonas hankookensis]|uniref:hypothetical protein n=1 Tax=Sphingomonas hankookensis TaxID=563996 RepID=UPI003D3034C8
MDSGIAGAHDAVLTGEACMGEGATFIRREGVKQECIALQMEGDDEARLLLYAQGLVNQAIADLLEDPEQMRKLLEIARFKPTLRLVHNRDSEHG